MNELNVTKVCVTDENMIFPICHLCKKELSAFSVTDKETFTNLPPESFILLVERKNLITDYFAKGKHLIFLCKHCIPNKKG